MANKGGRPSGEKTRCGGVWTEARFNSFIKSLLRQGTRKWGPIQQAIKDARVRRGFYLCAECKEEVPATTMATLKNGKTKRVKNAIVDHKEPIIPVTGFTTWDECIERMFCEQENLQVLCHLCHTTKCAEEAAERKLNNKSGEVNE